MNLWEALLLGIIQGVTEFLPISSSGHLILVQHLLGLKDLSRFVLFDLVCHLGTLGAILFVFSKEIKEMDLKKATPLIIALLPLFALVPFMKEIKGLFDQIQWIGFGFLITSVILFLGSLYGHTKPNQAPNALLIGLAQGLAILPAISRSGATISCGRLCGMASYEAIVFSFLLSIPTILGGMVLELLKLNAESLPEVSFSAYFSGFLSALIVGCFSLRLLIRIIETAKFRYFAWYCGGLGLLLIYLM